MSAPQSNLEKFVFGLLRRAARVVGTAAGAAAGVMLVNLLAWWCASCLTAVLARRLAGLCDPFIFSLALVLACNLLVTAWMELLFRRAASGLGRSLFNAARIAAQLWAAAVVLIAAAATIWPSVFRPR